MIYKILLIALVSLSACYHYNANKTDSSLDKTIVDNDTSGTHLWKYKTSAGIIVPVTNANNNIYVGNIKGEVYCIKISDKTLQWKFAASKNIFTKVVVSDNIAYFATEDNNLYAVHAITGKLIWQYKSSDFISTTPLVSNNQVYWGSGDHILYCLDAKNGNYKWKFASKDIIINIFNISDTYIRYNDFSGRIVTLDAFGKLKEEITTNSLGFHTALKKNIIYYFAPSGLICEDMATGKMIWNFPQKGMITNEPFYYKNTVYIGTGANLIYAINATTGEQKWSFTTDGTVIGDFVTDSSVILGHGGNYMYALDLETGLKKWELKFERKRPLAEPLIYHNSLYYGLSDSCIYEVRYKK